MEIAGYLESLWMYIDFGEGRVPYHILFANVSAVFYCNNALLQAVGFVSARVNAQLANKSNAFVAKTFSNPESTPAKAKPPNFWLGCGN